MLPLVVYLILECEVRRNSPNVRGPYSRGNVRGPHSRGNVRGPHSKASTPEIRQSHHFVCSFPSIYRNVRTP